MTEKEAIAAIEVWKNDVTHRSISSMAAMLRGEGFLEGHKEAMRSPEILALLEALELVNEVWNRENSNPDETNHMGDDEHEAWGMVQKALSDFQSLRERLND